MDQQPLPNKPRNTFENPLTLKGLIAGTGMASVALTSCASETEPYEPPAIETVTEYVTPTPEVEESPTEIATPTPTPEVREPEETSESNDPETSSPPEQPETTETEEYDLVVHIRCGGPNGESTTPTDSHYDCYTDGARASVAFVNDEGEETRNRPELCEDKMTTSIVRDGEEIWKEDDYNDCRGTVGQVHYGEPGTVTVTAEAQTPWGWQEDSVTVTGHPR